MGKIRFALLGCGRIFAKHVEALNADPRAELVAVCDLIPEKAKKYNLPYYTNYHEMLRKEDVDIVNILTPSGLHSQHTIDIANHYKKHIVCEKPMALNTHDAKWMIDACRVNDVRLFIVKQNRFNVPVVKLLDAVKAGAFGRLTMGTVRIRWCRSQKYYNDGWHGTKALDGGIFYNQASHHIDLLACIFGEVEEVSAMTTKRFFNLETEDVGIVILRFKSGALGIIEASVCVRPEDIESSLTVMGENGTIEVSGVALNKMRYFKFVEGIKPLPTLQNANVGLPTHFYDDENPPNVYGFSHSRYISHVIDCLKNGGNGVDGHEGLKSVSLIERIYDQVALDNLQRL
jgi:predicted dehydrogenase